MYYQLSTTLLLYVNEDYILVFINYKKINYESNRPKLLVLIVVVKDKIIKFFFGNMSLN